MALRGTKQGTRWALCANFRKWARAQLAMPITAALIWLSEQDGPLPWAKTYDKSRQVAGFEKLLPGPEAIFVLKGAFMPKLGLRALLGLVN